jgi:hypothetical protein
MNLIIYLLFFFSAQAQDTIIDEGDLNVDSHFYSIFTKIPDDYSTFGQQLMKREELLPISLTLGSSVLLYADDQHLWEMVSNTNKSSGYQHFWNNVELVNSGYFQIATTAFFFTWGTLGDERALRTSYQIARGILSSGIIVQIMKRATGRESPNKQTEPRGHWAGYPGESAYGRDVARYDAVPSGHLQSAVVTFMVIADNYPEQKWIPWVGWPMMGLFAYSLPASNIHWWSDIPIGVYLGYRFAKIITRNNYKKEENNANNFKWDVYPAMSSSGSYLLTLGMEF